MLKLQVSAGTGWPEQYFGDISIGNLATAKTVEAPVQRMVESYQSVWADTYDDIFQFILEQENVPEANRYVDIDMPEVSQESAASIAQAIQMMTQTFPQFAESPDVIQQALLTMGIENTSDAIAQLDKIAKESKGDVNVILAKALREFREVVKNGQT